MVLRLSACFSGNLCVEVAGRRQAMSRDRERDGEGSLHLAWSLTQLAVPPAAVICRNVIGVLELELRPEKNGGSDPVSPHHGFLRIFRLESCSLAFQIIQKVGADGDIVPGRKFSLQIIDHGPFRGKACQLSGRTESSVGVGFSGQWIGETRCDAGHVPFIHVPSLGIHVPRLVELVVPGADEKLHVVVSIVAPVEPSRTAPTVCTSCTADQSKQTTVRDAGVSADRIVGFSLSRIHGRSNASNDGNDPSRW
jgi:hypothetical protein